MRVVVWQSEDPSSIPSFDPIREIPPRFVSNELVLSLLTRESYWNILNSTLPTHIRQAWRFNCRNSSKVQFGVTV